MQWFAQSRIIDIYTGYYYTQGNFISHVKLFRDDRGPKTKEWIVVQGVPHFIQK